MRRLLPGLVYALMGVLLATALYLMLSRSADASLGNRELLCRGIVGNVNNPARNDPRVLALCDEVGVRP